MDEIFILNVLSLSLCSFLLWFCLHPSVLFIRSHHTRAAVVRCYSRSLQNVVYFCCSAPAFFLFGRLLAQSRVRLRVVSIVSKVQAGVKGDIGYGQGRRESFRVGCAEKRASDVISNATQQCKTRAATPRVLDSLIHYRLFKLLSYCISHNITTNITSVGCHFYCHCTFKCTPLSYWKQIGNAAFSSLGHLSSIWGEFLLCSSSPLPRSSAAATSKCPYIWVTFKSRCKQTVPKKIRYRQPIGIRHQDQ